MDSDQNTAASATALAPLTRYLAEEGHRKREALRSDTKARIAEAEAHAEEKKKQILSSAGANTRADVEAIESAVSGRARAQAEAVTSRRTGEAVSRIMTQCRERLQTIASTPEFNQILEELLTEAVDCAKDLAQPLDTDASLGLLMTAPQHVELCRRIVDDRGLSLTVKGDDDIWGGVEIIVTRTGDRVRNSLPSRMEKLSTDLRATASMRLQDSLRAGTTE